MVRVKSKSGTQPGESVVFASDSGEVNHLRTKKVMTASALDARPIAKDFSGDRRIELAKWITGPKNPFFSKIIVNRLWKHFLGRGIVEPVDDMRVTNPPSNPELLDYLAGDFVKSGFDMKHLIAQIMLSDVYQRSVLPTKVNVRDTKFYAHYTFKRMGAEQLLDALSAATGVSDKFGGYPAGTRASQLPDTTVANYTLDLFGRPARNITCECERQDAPNLGQILHLMNNAGINGRISSKEGRIAKLVASKLPDDKVIEDIYLNVVSRAPDAAEKKRGLKMLAISKNHQQTFEDMMWALLNSKEFLFNH